MPLIINDKYVNNLSGPVSIDILYPDEKQLEKFQYAPIFILLGDYHNNKENYCDPVEDEKKGHYRVDGGFLELLSDAVGDGEIVDFYLEGRPYHEQLDQADSGWPKDSTMHDLSKKFKNCYTNSRMELSPIMKNCDKIKNIRWQSSDIRLFKDYVEFYDYPFRMADILNDANKFFTPLDKGNYFLQRIAYEFVRYTFYNDFESILLLTLEEFKKAHLYNNRLIKKQLNKINNIIVREDLIKEFENYIDYEYEKDINKYNLSSFMELQNAIKQISSCCKYSAKYLNACTVIINKFNTGWIPYYISFLKNIRTLFSDLYILARIYKNMLKTESNHTDSTKIKYPLITVIYYGCYHTENLYVHLKRYGYTVDENNLHITHQPLQSSYNEYKPNRCINLSSTNFNLNELVNKLKTSRSAKLHVF